MLRHYLATLAYRTRGVLEQAPDSYSDFEVGSGVRSPRAILSHMNQVLRFAWHELEGTPFERLQESDWATEVSRFFQVLADLDAQLVRRESELEGSGGATETLQTLLQGPFADAMTHVGQLAMIRRLAGAPIPGENFMKAPIRAGELSGPPS